MGARKTLLTTAVAAVAACCAATPLAAAGVSRQDLTVEDGSLAALSWGACEPQSTTGVTEAPSHATPIPGAGGLEDRDDLAVTNVEIVDELATWTFAPTAKHCPPGATTLAAPITFTETLRLRWTDRRYVLRTSERNGVRKIAGWDVGYRVGRLPTVASARRHFGRPSKVVKGSSQDCRLTWRQLGIQITFVNYGTAGACSKGYAQYGTLLNPTGWAVQVGNRPGIIATSAPAYLVERGRADEVEGGWSLAEYFSPFGDAGYYPSVAAIGSPDHIRRFEFWIGAGGE